MDSDTGWESTWRGGWTCPRSPDGYCHYRSEDGRILLRDGRSVPVPPGHNAANESKEWCIYCGQPSERK
jgi:hypothetical protein